jgi:anti-sigma factor RsiW
VNDLPWLRAGCDRVRSRLERWLDGALSPLEEALDRGHLEACADCRGELSRWERVLDGIRAVSRADPGDLASVERSVLAKLEAAPCHVRSRPGLARAASILLAAAAAILAALCLRVSGEVLRSPPRFEQRATIEELLGRLPTWPDMARGLESLSRRVT